MKLGKMFSGFISMIFILIAVLLSANLSAQISGLDFKYDLDAEIDESSGLLFYNHKLITLNDSGNLARLYETDTISNSILRRIDITNATNVDWEALAQDDQYIYIGDIGNNLGNRTDLKIYRIAKSSYDVSNQVTADIISFSYSDQIDYTANSNTNFDAEAMIVKQGNILIFSKNHENQQCRLYILPKTPGTHTAVHYDSYDTQGMITGATYNPQTVQVFLTGYNAYLRPFVMYLYNFSGDRLFTGSVEKTNILQQGSQVESIAYAQANRYLISRESFSYNTTHIPASLFAFSSQYDTNEVSEAELNSCRFSIQNNIVKIDLPDKEDFDIEIINSIGQILWQKTYKHRKQVQVYLPDNLYIIRIFVKGKVFTKKIIID